MNNAITITADDARKNCNESFTASRAYYDCCEIISNMIEEASKKENKSISIQVTDIEGLSYRVRPNVVGALKEKGFEVSMNGNVSMTISWE